MKKIVSALTAIALLSEFAFAQEYKTATLESPIGKISFGAWGRSTFEIGQEKSNTKIDVNGGAMDETYRNLLAAYNAADTAGKNVLLSTYGLTEETITALNGFYGLETDTDNTQNFIRMNPDWSYGCRVGFWIIGRTNDEHFGFDFNLDSDAGALFIHKLWDSDENEKDVNYHEDGKYAVAIGDQAKMWGLFDVKPLATQFKVAFGKMREQVLRGSIGDFGQRESSDVKSEDDIFSEFWPVTGMFVSASGLKDTWIEGFYVAGCVDISGTLGINSTDTDNYDYMDMHDVFHNGQYGVGYTIPGVMQIKAQYWGDSITESNFRYAKSKYESARAAGFDRDDYYGRMEFGIDFLGFMGGANSFTEVDLEKTPNANLIEIGFKLPIMGDEDLREYDPETFYNWYSCIGTMGVIQKGFILYKAHLWGGQGVSNLTNYSAGLVTLDSGNPADIFMAGFDALAEVCVNPFGNQNLFVGLSGNYNITAADGDDSYWGDLKLRQHKAGAEIYIKKTFAANNFIFAGLSYRYSKATMDGTVKALPGNVSYENAQHTFYAPIGIEMFF